MTVLDQLDITNLEAANEKVNGIALFAVKTHAIKYGYDILVRSILEDIDTYNDKLGIGLDASTIDVLRNIRVIPFYRNISMENGLINAMYRRNIQKRGASHLAKLSTYYTGETFFFLIVSPHEQKCVEEALQKLKGQSEIFDDKGQITQKAEGLRGIFIPRQQDLLGKPEFKEKEYLFYNNIMHSSDDPMEVAMFCKMLLNKGFYELPNYLRAQLQIYIDNHYPTNLTVTEN